MNDRTYFLRSNQALYNATIEMFSARSFESASLNDIIKESNSNKGSFYYRFKDKQELYFSLIDAMFVEQVTFLNLQMEGRDSQSPNDYLSLLFESLIDLSREDKRFLYLNQQLFRESPTFYDIVIQNTLKSPFERIISKLTQSGVKLMPFWLISLHRFYGDFILYFNQTDFSLNAFTELLEKSLFDSSFDAIRVDDRFSVKLPLNQSLYKDLDSNDIYAIVDPFYDKMILNELDSNSIFILTPKKVPSSLSGCVMVSKKISTKLKVESYIKKELKKYQIEYDPSNKVFFDWMDYRMTDLGLVHQRMVLCFIALLRNQKQYLLYHMMDDLTEEEKAKLFEFLLKNRPSGSKMIVVDKGFFLAYHYAHFVSMIGKSGMIQTIDVPSIQNKYPIDTVVLKKEGQYSLVSKNDFLRYDIKSLDYFYTISSYLNLIFYLEMGDSCDE